MSYGTGWKKLNPCADDVIAAALRPVLTPACALLDLACGRGDRLRMLADVFPDVRLFGVDAEGGQLALAAAACPTAALCCGSAEALPYADGRMEVVLCECSFSLFSHPERAASEMFRVLRPGGTLLLSDLYTKSEPSARVQLSDGGAVKNIYGRAALEAYLTDAGLTPAAFADRSGDLLQMLGQMVLDGTACACLGAGALQKMKQLKTGYGLWLFRK